MYGVKCFFFVMQAFRNTFSPFCGLEHGVANDHMCNTTDNKTSIVDKMEIIQPTSLCGLGVHRNNIFLTYLIINKNSCDIANFFPMKLRGLGIMGSLQGKPKLSMEKGVKNQKETLCMYVVNKPCNIYRLQGNFMIIIEFPCNL